MCNHVFKKIVFKMKKIKRSALFLKIGLFKPSFEKL